MLVNKAPTVGLKCWSAFGSNVAYRGHWALLSSGPAFAADATRKCVKACMGSNPETRHQTKRHLLA